MKNTFIAILSLCLPFYTQAQKVSKQVVAEHFTNSYCSVCANRNPGFYANLQNKPEVLHIAYFPSSPYAACPFNQYNKDENDARTNFYNLYGATPRIAIQGAAISANENYSDPGIFNTAEGQTTSFAMKTELERQGNMLNLRVVVTKTDTSVINNLNIYAGIAEDTVVFASNNGESLQQDVFRKSFTGENPVNIAVPANVGDSTVYVQSINLDPALNLTQIYAYSILSTDDKQIEQGSRSQRLTNMTTAIPGLQTAGRYTLYPNPVATQLYLKGDVSKITEAIVVNTEGKRGYLMVSDNGAVNVSHLPAGVYFLKLTTMNNVQVLRFYRH